MDTRAVDTQRDMPIPPGEYMLVQDTTKGPVKVYVGPMVVNQTGQEQPVRYDADERLFKSTDLQGARRKCVFVPEDSYCNLHNPALSHDGSLIFPNEGQCSNPNELKHGERVNIPGPTMFALWPEQSASVIAGHRMRSNQYLLVEVVSGQKAQDNWTEGTLETTEGDDVTETVAEKMTFRTGELIIIKGIEAGFFIPCTGVRVVPDGRTFVRDAMTLEQLEFCILVGEDGKKRYEKGPQVVFPEPTEEFWTDEDGNKKFRAYELSKIAALYIKVIAPYEEIVGDKKVKHEAGEELFITGDETPIYFPRPQHAIVKYGASELHHATAITKGEGRYVLDRLSGHVKTEVGEQMLLPDARTHVIVKRILTAHECKLWFPSNTKAATHNEMLRAQAASDVIGYVESDNVVTANLMSKSLSTEGRAMQVSRVHAAAPAVADEMKRGTSYAPPRSVTLDTKMDGAVCIQVWTGFAVMIVGKDGKRKAVIGPATVLLDYDQTLEVLGLSTGKPKTTGKRKDTTSEPDGLKETVYLNVMHNKVSDIVNVHTKDQVEVNIKLSFHVDFTGESEEWFNVANYVKLLCDRVRSILKGIIRKVNIETLFADHVSIIRDIVLGKHDEESGGRKGMVFESNGMKVIDVDVLGFDIPDTQVAAELLTAQRRALTTSLQLQNKQREVEAQERAEKLEQQLARAQAETAAVQHDLCLKTTEDDESLRVRRQEALQAEQEAKHALTQAKEDTRDLEHARAGTRDEADHAEALDFKRGQEAIRLEGVEKETAALTTRWSAVSSEVAKAVNNVADKNTAVAIAEAVGPFAALTSGTIADTMARIFPGISKFVKPLLDGDDNNGVDTPR